MSKLRIQYISPDKVKDKKILNAISESVIKGTPRAESQAIRARVPNVFWSFQNTWKEVFIEGKVDHNLKELCRVYVSKSVQCKYCGNQRSSKSADDGLVEDDYRDLLDFEKSENYDELTKAALSLSQAITWDLETDDDFWNRLYKHFSEGGVEKSSVFLKRRYFSIGNPIVNLVGFVDFR